MKTRNSIFWLAVILVCPGAGRVAFAYDQPTHALVTDKAFQKSVLNPNDPNSIVKILMFDRLDPTTPFLLGYADNQAGNNDPSLYTRFGQEEERAVFRSLIDAGRIPNASSVSELEYRVDGWLMDGAIREDDIDYMIAGQWRRDDQRDPDPWGYLFRSSNHFYDPIHDRAFDYAGPCADYGCMASPQWALGTMHPLNPPGDSIDTSRRNHFTWEDARNNYWWALTLERIDPNTLAVLGFQSSQERLERWATAIKSLGHVVHLLQDGAQPQHVRNDAHAPAPASMFAGTNYATSGAYEDFTDYRVTGVANTGWVGALRYMDESLPPPNQIPPLTFDGYPIPSFATPAEFFTTRYYDNGTDTAGINARRGMIDFANRNFFTAGTPPGFEECVNPGPGTSPCTTRDSSPTYPLPENDLTNPVYTQVPTILSPRINGMLAAVTLFARQTVDPLAPGFDSTILPASFGGKTPIAAKGALYYRGLPAGVSTELTYANFIYDANVLLPRAVSYSAGLINYFFRGTIQVDAPQDGLFGLVDHALAHSVDADGYPHCTATVPGAAGEPDFCTANSIYGFTKIRLKIRNNTPAIVESGTGTSAAQTMSATSATPAATDPQLVAVARYHRNLCYQATLQGEAVVDYQGNVTQNNCTAGNRTGYQEISVSMPLAISAANLNGPNSYAVAFDFSSDPIPINATDLFIQVVYRGQLGAEPDGIAMGMIDVSEPTYLTLWNDSDYAGCNGAWVTGNAPGCGFANGIGRAINNAYLCIGGQSVYVRYAAGGNGTIYLGKFVRLAALLDNQQHTAKATLSVGTGNTAAYIRKSITGQSRQAPMEIETAQQPYVPDAMFIKRGMIGSFRPMPFYQLIGADPQPANDAGALDVGALTPAFATGLPFGGGTLNFPNTPANPIPGCTN